MKNSLSKSLVLSVGAVAVGVLLIVLVGMFAVVDSEKTTVACSGAGKAHTVTVKNEAVTPAQLTAKLCDSVTFKNSDPKTIKLGFGNHNHHTEFSGVEEQIIKSGRSFTLRLTQTGTVTYHDHYNYDTEGTLKVTR